MQQKTMCRLYRERDEMVNYIVRKCSKLNEKEYKTRHDLIGKMTDQELCR